LSHTGVVFTVLPVRRDNSLPARVSRGARQLRASAPNLLPVRRKETRPQRFKRRARELLPAAPELDVPWARSRPAGATREAVLRLVLAPLLAVYIRRRTTGRRKLTRLKAPVILVANHVSHLDTPVILGALPRRMRKRTVVAAATDYFYRNRVTAFVVSLIFNTVPLDRKGGGLDKESAGHLDGLIDQGWNVLVYPEGTRSRSGSTGRLKRGAAVLAARHHVSIIPIRITGTREAMPPGRFWPTRMRSRNGHKRHPVNISFGDPIAPSEDVSAVTEIVRHYFEGAKQLASSSRRADSGS
jgi:1-acyl-sn-glycerol-3-phosphate acyltransferase